MGATKKKLNLTIDESVLEKAKRLMEARGESLSALVEDFLARLVLDAPQESEDSLRDFHARYLKKNYREPSDRKIRDLRKGLIEKHS